MTEPVKGRKSFLFGTCLVDEQGDLLTVTLPPGALFLRGERLVDGQPTGTAEAIAPQEILVTCAGKTHTRRDSVDYPRTARWTGGVRVIFRGGATFSRLLLDEGPVLLVQASVRKVEGLPHGISLDPWETIRFEVVEGAGSAADEGASASKHLNGPHHPYP